MSSFVDAFYKNDLAENYVIRSMVPVITKYYDITLALKKGHNHTEDDLKILRKLFITYSIRDNTDVTDKNELWDD